jgi:integrase
LEVLSAMPLLKNIDPKYSHHKATGRAFVTLNRRIIYLGKYGSSESRAEYRRLIAEWDQAGRQSIPAGDPGGTDIQINELIARYWQYVESYYRHPDGSPTPEVDHFRSVLGLLRANYGHTMAVDFGPLALKALRSKMVKAGLCRSTINSRVRRIRMMMRWAASEEIVPETIYARLATVSGLRAGKTAAREPKAIKPVDDAVVDATLPHLSNVVRAMVQAQRFSGARSGEICTMRTCDIDTTGPVWTYKPASHKTAHHGHQRTIFIGPKAQQVLRPFLKPLNPTAYLFSPRESEADRRAALSDARKTPPCCGNSVGSNRKRRPKKQPGERYSSGSYRKAVIHATDRADLWAKAGMVIENDVRIVPRWHLHQLRHGFASLVRRDFNLDSARTLLGHRTATVTETYSEPDMAHARSVVAVIG